MLIDELLKMDATCRKKGIERTDWLAAAGVDYSTWWRWENKKSTPREDLVVKLREALARLTA